MLSILCDPVTHEPLKLVREPADSGQGQDVLVSVSSGHRYPVRDGIPVFIEAAGVAGLNLKYQRLYDRFASLYDPALNLLSRLLFRVSDIDLRRQYLEQYLSKDGGPEITQNTRVLEVSVGTGHNIMALPDTGQYYGLDISRGMLMRCRRNMTKHRRSIELVQGNAEQLPFVDNAFDVVFHVGGINFFSDKAKAIAEMARVARPGTKILIVDETEKVIKKSALVPVGGGFYRGMERMAVAPADLVPASMLDVRVDYFLKGNMYALSFVKP